MMVHYWGTLTNTSHEMHICLFGCTRLRVFHLLCYRTLDIIDRKVWEEREKIDKGPGARN